MNIYLTSYQKFQAGDFPEDLGCPVAHQENGQTVNKRAEHPVQMKKAAEQEAVFQRSDFEHKEHMEQVNTQSGTSQRQDDVPCPRREDDLITQILAADENSGSVDADKGVVKGLDRGLPGLPDPDTRHHHGAQDQARIAQPQKPQPLSVPEIPEPVPEKVAKKGIYHNTGRKPARLPIPVVGVPPPPPRLRKNSTVGRKQENRKKRPNK